jgi:hypothetical protein
MSGCSCTWNCRLVINGYIRTRVAYIRWLNNDNRESGDMYISVLDRHRRRWTLGTRFPIFSHTIRHLFTSSTKRTDHSQALRFWGEADGEDIA